MEKRLQKKEMQDRFKKEVYMVKALDHPNIVQVIEYFEDKERIYIVFEYLKGGELFCEINKRIKEKRRWTEKQAARVISQVNSAINYLHMNSIMHRDVKPDNILFVESGEHKCGGRVKLIDFGTAIKFKPGKFETEIYGSPSYLAPEVLNQEYTEKCDIWSLGVILYTMILHHLPYDGFDDVELIKEIKTKSIGFKEALDK